MHHHPDINDIFIILTVKVHHRYTVGLVYFRTDNFIALSCAIKMTP